MKHLLTIILIKSIVIAMLFSSSCNKDEQDSPGTSGELPIVFWPSGEDIIITEDFYVDSINLIIDPGVNVKIAHGCNIIVGNHYPAELNFNGTEENPINFTTYNPQGQPELDYWGSIIIKSHYSKTFPIIFENCNFIKGGGQETDAVIINHSTSLSMVNCLIDYSLNYGIQCINYGRFEKFMGNTIKHTLNHPVIIKPSYANSIGDSNYIITEKPNQGIFLGSGSININKDTLIWRKQTVPYIIEGNLNISGNSEVLCSFNIEEGSVISLEEDSHIYFDSDVDINITGTLEDPIIFTSSKLKPEPGDWHSIRFNYDASATFNNCIFEYGGTYEDGMSYNGMIRLYSSTNVSFENCTFRYSESCALLLYKNAVNRPMPKFKTFSNNTFELLESHAISLPAESVNSIDISNNFNNHTIYIQNESVESNYIYWKNFDTEYFLDSYLSLYNDRETTMEIEAGCKITFDKGGIKIGSGSKSKLIANGTEENPIVFTSAKENPYYGDWGGIAFYNNTLEGSILNHCEVLYAGECSINLEKASIHIYNNDSKISITNSTIAHSSNKGIKVSSYSNPYLFNNILYDNLGGN